MAQYVRDLRRRQPIWVEYTDSIQTAIDTMKKENTHSVLVKPFNAEEQPLIFTSTDEITVLQSDELLLHEEEVGSHSSIITHVVTLDTTIQECRRKFAAFKIRHLPIVDHNGVIIGMVSQEDVRQ